MMTFLKSMILLLLMLSGFTKITAQAPPPEAMPTKSNAILVDKIIEATDHEKYFTEYCTKKVMEYAKENSWTKEQISDILASIQFKYYSSTIYNSYASYTTAQLTMLLNIMEEFKRTSENDQIFILTNQMMQSNLDLFVRGVIKGIYVSKRK